MILLFVVCIFLTQIFYKLLTPLDMGLSILVLRHSASENPRFNRINTA
jgi:hypothetical protein